MRNTRKKLPLPKAVPLAREGDIYLASGPGFWGKGSTIAEARQAATFTFHDGEWIVYSVHPETIIDGGGSFRYPRGHHPVEIANGYH